MRLTPKTEGYLCVGLLALLPLLAMAPSIINGTVPLDGSWFLSLPPWQEAQPADFAIHAQNPAAGFFRYEWFAFLHETAHSGQSLLWNPLEACGTPFFAVWQTRCLSPFSLPYYFFPVLLAFLLSILLKLIVAGWCAYYAARRFGYASPLALVAGVAFQFSGGIFLWAAWPISDVLPWFPLLLVSMERLALSRTHYWPLASLAIAVMGLGGDPGAFVAAIVFALAYLVIRMLLMRTPFLSLLANVSSSGVAVFFGFALLAVQLLPYYEFTQQGSLADYGPVSALRLENAALCLLPNLLDNTPISATTAGVARDFHALKLFHVGIIQLLGAILWLGYFSFVSDSKRKRINALFLTSVLMTFVAIVAGGKPGGMFGLAFLSPAYFVACNAIIIVIIAVAASEQWLLFRRDEIPAALWRLVYIVPPLFVVAVVFFLASRHQIRSASPSLGIQLLIAALFVVAFVGLARWTVARPSTRLMGYGLALLTLFSLLYTAIHEPATKTDLIFPETAFISALKQNGERVAGGPELAHWPLDVNLIPQVYDPGGIRLERPALFLERLKGEPKLTERTGATDLLLTQGDIQGPFVSMRPMLSIRDVFSTGAVLFKNPKAKPRAWVAYEGRTVEHFDPAALSPSLPPLIEGVTLPASAADPAPKISVSDRLNTRVQVEVESAQPGVLVLCDAYYPGWKAVIDGQDAQVFPVDGMFRGVAIKEGKHHIEFYYMSTYLKTGLLITLAAALIILFELRHIPVHFQE